MVYIILHSCKTNQTQLGIPAPNFTSYADNNITYLPSCVEVSRRIIVQPWGNLRKIVMVCQKLNVQKLIKN